jgi:hypothetical protein
MRPSKQSHKESLLDFLLGEWVNTGEVTPGAFGPGGPVTSSTNYAWEIGNKWLIYDSTLDLPGLGPYEVHGGVGFNPEMGAYQAFAVNSMGNLMLYRGHWEDASTLVFMLTNPGAEGSARVVYEKQSDGSVHMGSDHLIENGHYESYFTTKMVRQASVV